MYQLNTFINTKLNNINLIGNSFNKIFYFFLSFYFNE